MANSLATFYRGKTVLVTGHTGFKGAWLSEWLKILGARVIGFALPPNDQPNLFDAAHIGEAMSSVLGDLREFSAVRAVFEEHAPEIVFHNAAQPLVRRSYREPVTTYATNVMGTVHVLEAARNTSSVRAVVVVTSDKCYDNKDWLWGYREADPIGGRDPYSSSKGCAELVTAAYRHSFFHKNEGSAAVASARAGNVIAGGDWAEDRLVPDIVRSISSGNTVVLRHPNAHRRWQYVLEPIRGYLMLGEFLGGGDHSYAQAWNFGPNDEASISVSELAMRMIRFWGKGQLTVQPKEDDLHEAQYLKLDCSKAHAWLGWKPMLSIDESLQLTVEWYRNYLEDPQSAPRMTAKQIRDYMGRLKE